MHRLSRASRIALLIANLVVPFAVATPSLGNTFACCLPDGGCENLLIMTCDDRGGASLVGRNCMDAPCRPSAPLLSPFALVVLLTGISAVAIHGLRRRGRTG